MLKNKKNNITKMLFVILSIFSVFSFSQAANPNAPVIADATVSLAENLVNGTVVRDMHDSNTGNDNDADGDHITYNIASGNVDSAFLINAADGKIKINDTTKINYEVNNQYVLTINADDGFGRSDTAQITIDIEDANDAPKFSINVPSVTKVVLENNAAVMTAGATDEDASDTLTYSIDNTSPDPAKFNIDSSTGAISFKSGLIPDFENPGDANGDNEYEITVIVTDDATPALTDQLNLTIKIGDVDEDNSNFVIKIDSNNTSVGSTADTEFEIPVNDNATLSYDFAVDCNNDGITEVEHAAGNVTCSYTTPGIYTVRIKDNTGTLDGFPAIKFGGAKDQRKLLSIEQWGKLKWKTFYLAFTGTLNMNGVGAVDIPDLSNFDDTLGGFTQAFFSSSFNQSDIVNWDVSSVEKMNYAFWYATAFNQNIGSWNVSNVKEMQGMFTEATAFNQNIGSWNVSNVENMNGMFAHASSFNQDISSWNVSNVENMGLMFTHASSFNQDISSWNVSNVENMGYLFQGASLFNQDLGLWDISKVTNMTDMFDEVTLSTENYDSILNGWNARTLKPNVHFNAGNSNYCAGEAARANMIASDSWDITDLGKYCNTAPTITSNDGGDTASINVDENQTAVTTVVATDIDPADSIIYSISAGADQALFTIDSVTGVLTFNTAPDFETPASAASNNDYVVEVTASDDGSPVLTDTQTITVTVDNVNEAPVITSNGGNPTATINVNENQTAVTTVVATDADAGETIIYSITGGNDQSKFKINSTGVLSFRTYTDYETPTDHNTDNVYEVIVSATDSNVIPLADTQSINVVVKDLDDMTGHSKRINRKKDKTEKSKRKDNKDVEEDNEDENNSEGEDENNSEGEDENNNEDNENNEDNQDNGDNQGQSREELINQLKEKIRIIKAKIEAILLAREEAKKIQGINLNLKKGDTDATTNGAVSILQQFLINEDVYPEALVTGYYGNLTGSAVYRWEVKNNISYPGVEWRPTMYANNDKGGFAIGGYRLD